MGCGELNQLRFLVTMKSEMVNTKGILEVDCIGEIKLFAKTKSFA